MAERSSSGAIHGQSKSTATFTGCCVWPNASCRQSSDGPKIVTECARQPASNQDRLRKTRKLLALAHIVGLGACATPEPRQDMRIRQGVSAWRCVRSKLPTAKRYRDWRLCASIRTKARVFRRRKLGILARYSRVSTCPKCSLFLWRRLFPALFPLSSGPSAFKISDVTDTTKEDRLVVRDLHNQL
jgi:hypothetical protein